MRLPAEALSVTCTSTAGSHVPLPDVLGSVRILLDGGQNLTDGYAFEGFGSQVSGGGSTSNPYRYVGLFGYYEDQETGLVLLSRRYYDASVGRFLTRDPIDYAGGAISTAGFAGALPNDTDRQWIRADRDTATFGLSPHSHREDRCCAATAL